MDVEISDLNTQQQQDAHSMKRLLKQISLRDGLAGSFFLVLLSIVAVILCLTGLFAPFDNDHNRFMFLSLMSANGIIFAIMALLKESVRINRSNLIIVEEAKAIAERTPRCAEMLNSALIADEYLRKVFDQDIFVPSSSITTQVAQTAT